MNLSVPLPALVSGLLECGLLAAPWAAESSILFIETG
jgi:hypothetical protein